LTSIHLTVTHGSETQRLNLLRASAQSFVVVWGVWNPTQAGHFKQIIETFEQLDTIFDEIDLLEEDPPHRGVAMRNARVRPYWIQAEEKEWQGLWDKGAFKKWSRKDVTRTGLTLVR
jgi:hypothetical protein